MKAVLDTNVLVSALLYEYGLPANLLKRAGEKFDLCYSPDIIEELKGVLQRKFFMTFHRADYLGRRIEEAGSLVYPEKRLSVVKNDPSDNKILECALEAEADFLVTGDKKHLLSLKHRFPFRIVSPSTFYQILLSLDDPSA